MAVPENTYGYNGYQTGYSQPRQERITLPSISEALRSQSALLPAPAVRSPGYYTGAAPERPAWLGHHVLPVQEARGRVEDWRHQQQCSVPRRPPTPQACPPLPPISPSFDYSPRDLRSAGGYSGHGQYDGRPCSSDGGYSQGSWGQGGYGQGVYDPRGDGNVGYADGSHTPNGHHQNGHRGATSGSPDGGQRGRKRSAAGEERADAEKKRRNFPPAVIAVLKRWVERKIDHLHFSNEEKADIAREAGMGIKQVDDWFTNYRRRGYPEHRHAFHAAARASAKAAYDSAVAEARRAAQVGSADALSAAEAEVARLAVLKDEADDRLAKAEAALAEHHAKISGRKQRDGDD